MDCTSVHLHALAPLLQQNVASGAQALHRNRAKAKIYGRHLRRSLGQYAAPARSVLELGDMSEFLVLIGGYQVTVYCLVT